MSKPTRKISVEIVVGLFMVLVFVVLGVFTIVLSRDGFLQKRYAYEIVFPEIAGLREGDNIFVRGMNIGRVRQTELRNGGVRVHVLLEQPLVLREGYRIEVVGSSMLGGKQLKIYEGPLGAREHDDADPIVGLRPVDMMEELADAVNGLQAMVDSANAGEGSLGKLLKDDSIYQNLAQTSEDLKSIVGRIENGEGSLGMLLAADDGQLYVDSKAIVANVRTISQNLADGKGALGKLVSSEDGAYDDLQATLASIRSIAEAISAGEGTLGKLVRDEGLYDEVKKLMEEARAGLDDMREVSPITSFGSVLFGAF